MMVPGIITNQGTTVMEVRPVVTRRRVVVSSFLVIVIGLLVVVVVTWRSERRQVTCHRLLIDGVLAMGMAVMRLVTGTACQGRRARD